MVCMLHSITRGQWESINPDYRVEQDGQTYFRSVDLATYTPMLVPVAIVDQPEPAEVPEHYAGTWPLDPRD